MARILVVRTGGTWYGEGDKKPSGLQSQDNHTAVARALCAAGHDVMCVGRIEGELQYGDIFGNLHHKGSWNQLSWSIKPSLGIDGNMEEIARIRRAVSAWAPTALVNVCGSELTTLSPVTAKQRGIETIDAAWRYGWPLVEILDELRLPRICVITDVRCYPRESELSLHDWMRPAAVLSQQTIDFERSSAGGGRWLVMARYAGIERLRLTGIRPMRPTPSSELLPRCIALAHAHVDDAVICKNKRELWSWIGSSGAPTIDAYGSGWDNFEGNSLLTKKTGRRFSLGAIRPMGEIPHGSQMYEALSRYPCGPLVPMGHGWVSPKYREYALAGCVPLPYGRANSAMDDGIDLLTYDYSPVLKDGHCCPVGAQTRFGGPHELNDLLMRCYDQQSFRQEQLELALHRSEPDSSKLLECVEHFAAGLRDSEMSHELWGGYERKMQ